MIISLEEQRFNLRKLIAQYLLALDKAETQEEYYKVLEKLEDVEYELETISIKEKNSV